MPYGYPPQQQYPPAPPMGYPNAPQFPQAPPQQFGYPQQQPQAAPTPPPAPVVSGTIDQFYSQPSAAGGPGISWKDKPIGATYAGIIAGECKVQQDTDFDSGQPLFQKDQVTPKFVMLVPLRSVQSNMPTPEFPDGEAVFYVRGQARDELVRAMSEAGCSGAPQQGATFQVTLTQRKPNRKGNPSNIVQIKYLPPNGVAHQAPETQQEHHAAAVSEQEHHAAAVSEPQHAPAPPAPEQPQHWAQPTPDQAQFQQVPQPAQFQQVPQPVAQPQAPQQFQQPAPQAPPQVQQPVQQQGVSMPADFNAEQQALLARITGGQQGGQPTA